MELFLPTAKNTHSLGHIFGALAGPNTVITLKGDLGAGKTSFSRGVGAGLGVKGIVSSPTYIIVRSHDSGRLPFWHADLYRLGGIDELEQLGFLEQLVAGGVVVIEWPDGYFDEFPTDRIDISITEQNEGRLFQMTAQGSTATQLLNDVLQQY